MKRNRVKRRQPHANPQSRCSRSNAPHNLPQKPRAILETPSILPFSCVRAQKLMT